MKTPGPMTFADAVTGRETEFLYLDVAGNLVPDVFKPVHEVYVDPQGHCYPGLDRSSEWYQSEPLDMGMEGMLAHQRVSDYATRYAMHDHAMKHDRGLMNKLHEKIHEHEHMRTPMAKGMLGDDKALEVRERLRARIAQQRQMRGQVEELVAMAHDTHHSYTNMGKGGKGSKATGRHWNCNRNKAMGVFQPMPRGVGAF